MGCNSVATTHPTDKDDDVRTLKLVAAFGFALLLAACGGSTPSTNAASTSARTTAPSSTTTPSTSSVSSTRTTSSLTTSSTTLSPTHSSPSATSSSTSSATSSGTPDRTTTATSTAATKAAPATVVQYVWPSASSGWSIKSQDWDLCAESAPESSGFAASSSIFTCVPTATFYLACKHSGHQVTCIDTYSPKSAITFTSSASFAPSYPVAKPVTPIEVELANGQVCGPISHDQTMHYQNRQSWMWCSTAEPVKAILVKPSGSYLNTSSPTWTAEYDVGTAKPTTVAVTRVVYAK